MQLHILPRYATEDWYEGVSTSSQPPGLIISPVQLQCKCRLFLLVRWTCITDSLWHAQARWNWTAHPTDRDACLPAQSHTDPDLDTDTDTDSDDTDSTLLTSFSQSRPRTLCANNCLPSAVCHVPLYTLPLIHLVVSCLDPGLGLASCP